MGMARGGRVAANHEKVVLTGRGLKEAIVRQEAEFVIDGTEAGPGMMELFIMGFNFEYKGEHCSLVFSFSYI